MVGVFTLEIGQFEVAPVMQSWSFGSGAGRQTPPVRSSLRLGDLLGGAGNPLRLGVGPARYRRPHRRYRPQPSGTARQLQGRARSSRLQAEAWSKSRYRLARMWPSGEPDRRSSPSQIQRPIDEGMAVTRHVGSKNTDLTVRNFARRTSILPRYSARCLALLEKAGLIDHQHRVLVGKMLSDIVAHHIAQSIGIPPVTAQNRLLPPWPRSARRLRPHPSGFATLVAKQTVHE